MEKQIEEMAKVICKYYEADKYCCGRCPDCYARDEAKKLYNAGYRKQREVEWIILEPEIGLCGCSVCEHMSLRIMSNYCPHCGSKMKGGE